MITRRTKKCIQCSGTGLYNFPYTAPCFDCNGRGFIIAYQTLTKEPKYLYIIIEGDTEQLELVRSLARKEEGKPYWGGNTKRVRAYTVEGHARLALKRLGRGKLLRVNLHDGEII